MNVQKIPSKDGSQSLIVHQATWAEEKLGNTLQIWPLSVP